MRYSLKDNFFEIIKGDNVQRITESNRVILLEYKRADAQTITNITTQNGIDGEITHLNTYAPFEISFTFFYEPTDYTDRNLFEQKIIETINQYDAYYIRNSYNPNMRYAVNKADYEILKDENGLLHFSLKFNVFKGYSESVHSTLDSQSINDGNFDIGMGIITTDTPKYQHQTTIFRIYNSSSMKVTPLMRHKLIIKLSCIGSPTVKNKTTGDVFSYKKTLNKKDELNLNGVYPYVNGNRCGRDTNHGIITLETGWNEFEITNATNIDVSFDFNFIYR